MPVRGEELKTRVMLVATSAFIAIVCFVN